MRKNNWPFHSLTIRKNLEPNLIAENALVRFSVSCFPQRR